MNRIRNLLFLMREVIIKIWNMPRKFIIFFWPFLFVVIFELVHFVLTHIQVGNLVISHKDSDVILSVTYSQGIILFLAIFMGIIVSLYHTLYHISNDSENIKEINNYVKNEIAPRVSEYLDYKSSKLNSDMGSQFNELKNILQLFVDHPEISNIISLQLVKQVKDRLDEIIHPILTNDLAPSKLKDSRNARYALKCMLVGLESQISESSTYGLFLENVSPDPKDPSMKNQYPDFVKKAIKTANYFFGISLMPPSWWEKNNGVDLFGLDAILEGQKKRIQSIVHRDYCFARIFIIRLDFLEPHNKYNYLKSKIDERRSIYDAEYESASDEDKEFLTLFVDANTDEKRRNLYRHYIRKDECLQRVLKKHIEYNILVGIRIVEPKEYCDARDFVYVVDDHGVEGVIFSYGFDDIIQKNNVGDEMDLRDRILNRFKGYVEGRLLWNQKNGLFKEYLDRYYNTAGKMIASSVQSSLFFDFFKKRNDFIESKDLDRIVPKMTLPEKYEDEKSIHEIYGWPSS